MYFRYIQVLYTRILYMYMRITFRVFYMRVIYIIHTHPYSGGDGAELHSSGISLRAFVSDKGAQSHSHYSKP